LNLPQLIVTAVKEDDTVLRGSTLNYLLFNLCFSNLIISFLVTHFYNENNFPLT
jgi:hypothetical protein